MERKKMVEEKNIQRNSSTIQVSKSVEAPIKIDSIYIDLGILMEKKDTRTNHQHFSIRGYVSEMRDKNIQDCKPFPSEPLEPLVVPRFRYWRCEKCCQEIFAASASQVVLDSSEASLNVNADKGCERCSEKEKSSKVDNMAVNGHDQNSMEVDEIQENGSLALNLAKIPPCLLEETNQDGPVAINEICEATRVDDLEKHTLAEIDEEHENLTLEKSKETMKIDETTMAVKDKITLQVKGRRGVSSRMPRRKPRKVRFLSEILARNETNSDIDHTKGAGDNPIPEETTTLAKYSRKRKRNLPLAPSRETPSTNNEAKDAREIQGDTESAVAVINISDSESKEDASSTGMCWESTYKPLEQTGNISYSSKLEGKMRLFEDGQMQHEKAMPNFEIGESSTANLCLGEGVLQEVNESIARTAEIIRRQQLSGKAGNMSATVAPNHFPGGSVDLPNHYPSNTETHEQRQDLNKEKKIMEFDLNLPAPDDEDLEAVAALQLLSLRDPERHVLVPDSDELNCTVNRNPAEFSSAYEENEDMIQLIKGKGNEKKGN